MRAYKILYLLASWLLVRPTSASWPAGTYELRFQNDELDNSTIIKRPLQPLVLRCQVKLVHKFARQDELASEKNASQLVIDWLKDELPLAGEQVNVISVELAAGSKSANSRPLAKPGAQKGRIEIKNTLNPNQLKLSSRLKLNRLRTGDSGRYRCRARATLGPAGELSADSSGSQLLVSSSRVAAAEQARVSNKPRAERKGGARSSALDRIISGNDWQQSAAKPDPARPPDGGQHASAQTHIESQEGASVNNGRTPESDRRNNGLAGVELAPMGTDEEWTSSNEDNELSGSSSASSGLADQTAGDPRMSHFESAKVSIAEMVHRIAPDLGCYVGIGDSYRGHVALSSDNQACIAWPQVALLAPSLELELDDPELDHNFCRNFNKDPLGPWCYVRELNNSSVLVRRSCKLSACSDFFWLYLVGPPLFLLSVLFCLSLATLRSIQHLYRGRSLFAPSKRSKTFPTKLSKMFALGATRKGYPNGNRKPPCGNYLDDDVFEIVHDIDWSDASQLNSTSSPKSTSESLQLNSSISSSAETDRPSCKSVNHAPPDLVSGTSNATQQASLADLLGAISRPSAQTTGPMFATLRCQIRNKGSQRLSNQSQVNKSTSTFMAAELAESAPRASRCNRQKAVAEVGENWPAASPSDSLASPCHTEPAHVDDLQATERLRTYSHASDLPQLEASSVTLALDQALIYEGKFSQVHLAYIRTSASSSRSEIGITAGRVGTQVAVNYLKPLASIDATLFNPDQLQLRNLNHLNLLKIVGFYMQEQGASADCKASTCALVYDMSQLVDLVDWLKQQNSDSLTSKQPGEDLSLRQNLTCFAKQIALALDYLHDQSIIYKDLACRNCFLDPTKLLIKLASFNLEPVMRAGETVGQNLKSMIRPKYLLDYYVIDSRPSECQLLPLSWIPLESILFNKFNKQTDIWSYGCLIYELFSLGEVVYFGYSSKQVIDAIRANLMPPKPLLCPSGIYKLMCKCLSDIPNFRPSVKQIYEQLNLYGGQCSSFLDHHLCLLTPTISDSSQYEGPTASCGSTTHQQARLGSLVNETLSKTKSHANIQACSSREQMSSQVDQTADISQPGSTKVVARGHELAKLPNSRSINLTTATNRLQPSNYREESSFVASADTNQYDEPQVQEDLCFN